MNYKDMMNAIGEASGMRGPGTDVGRRWGEPPKKGAEFTWYAPGTSAWEGGHRPDLKGMPLLEAYEILLKESSGNLKYSEVLQVQKIIKEMRAARERMAAQIGQYPTQPPGVQSYGAQQPPTRSLPIERPDFSQPPTARSFPIERPDFSQPPMGGGSTRNVQWEGPGNPNWERRMRERAMGGMK